MKLPPTCVHAEVRAIEDIEIHVVARVVVVRVEQRELQRDRAGRRSRTGTTSGSSSPKSKPNVLSGSSVTVIRVRNSSTEAVRAGGVGAVVAEGHVERGRARLAGAADGTSGAITAMPFTAIGLRDPSVPCVVRPARGGRSATRPAGAPLLVIVTSKLPSGRASRTQRLRPDLDPVARRRPDGAPCSVLALVADVRDACGAPSASPAARRCRSTAG